MQSPYTRCFEIPNFLGEGLSLTSHPSGEHFEHNETRDKCNYHPQLKSRLKRGEAANITSKPGIQIAI
jgi:hypothetical protein